MFSVIARHEKKDAVLAARKHIFLLGIKEILMREFHQKPEDAERLALLAVQRFPLVRWNDYEPALHHAVALTAVNDEKKGEGNAEEYASS